MDVLHTTLMQERILGPPHQRSFVGPLVYIGNNATAERLGCNTTACSCFFRFQGSDRPSVEQVCPAPPQPQLTLVTLSGAICLRQCWTSCGAAGQQA